MEDALDGKLVAKYQEEMGKIALTPEQEDAMVAKMIQVAGRAAGDTAASAAGSAAGNATDGSAGSAAGSAADGSVGATAQHMAPATKRRSHTLFRSGLLKAAAVAAGLALAVGLGSQAYADGQLVGVASAIDDVFGGTSQTEIVQKVGRPVNAVDSSNGVSVSADAVIGDQNNYVIVYSIWRDDGQPFGEVGTDKNRILTIDGKHVSPEGFNVLVDGATGQGGSVYFYDADPSDNAIQMVAQMTTNVNVIGGTARTTLSGIELTNDGNCQTDSDVSGAAPEALASGAAPEALASGTWNLKFKVNYENDAVELSPTGNLQVAGYTATVDSISVSPVAISINYTVDGTEKAPAESGQWSPSLFSLGNITVTMTDGTSFTVPSGAATSSESNGRTTCETGTFFDRTIDPSQVASVSFGGITAAPQK